MVQTIFKLGRGCERERDRETQRDRERERERAREKEREREVCVFGMYPGAVVVVVDAIVQDLGLQLGFSECRAEERGANLHCLRVPPSPHVPDTHTQLHKDRLT